MRYWLYLTLIVIFVGQKSSAGEVFYTKFMVETFNPITEQNIEKKADYVRKNIPEGELQGLKSALFQRGSRAKLNANAIRAKIVIGGTTVFIGNPTQDRVWLWEGNRPGSESWSELNSGNLGLAKVRCFPSELNWP